MLYLKVSTAVILKIGPFLDSADASAETGLTVSQGDVRLSKNGGNMAQKSDATACSHDEVGFYDCPINSTDTNTLGRLQLMVAEAGTLPVFHEYMVVTANVYDTLCSTDNFDVNLNASQAGVTIGTVTTLTNKSNFSLAADQTAVTVGAVNTKTGYELATTGNGIDGILDEPVDGTLTLRQAIMLIKAVLVGKSSGGGTDTINFRDHADTKNRVTATVDADGNRTAVATNTA